MVLHTVIFCDIFTELCELPIVLKQNIQTVYNVLNLKFGCFILNISRAIKNMTRSNDIISYMNQRRLKLKKNVVCFLAFFADYNCPGN